uniref:F-box domain-containing protein n=1 Tax=Caenorhabditis tropicalis TaxID=1561998 RepID=A0A1I7ULI6_9PELO
MENGIPLDIFRRIAVFSTNSRTLLDLWDVNEEARTEIRREVRSLSRTLPIRVDLRQFFNEGNPFTWEFFDADNKEHKKLLLERTREMARLLERLLEIGDRFQIENLNAAALGFQAEFDERYLPRVPFMLQKKLMHILKQFQTTSVSISPVFMRPSRVIRTFRDRFDQITTLDLGSMRPLAACHLRQLVFPQLVNLENFTWNHADIEMLNKIPNKENMKTMNLTCHVIGRPRWQDYKFLSKFKNLESFYLGFTVPHKPSRMTMDILLNLYQAIWDRKTGNLLESFPEIKEIGFWNAPEKIFQQLSKRIAPLETLNFGQLNQSLSQLCSFDSVLQAFFKFEELENAIAPPVIKNLNMNLHTMPAVGLDYYLPNLMNHVNRLPDLESVSLLFNCIFHAEMTSSWSMESNSEKSSRRRPTFDTKYTKFELHSEGLCGLTDLDRQLPPSLESCTISLNLPAESGKKVIDSVIKFISKMASSNDFPELREFHIQILGVKCFEKLVHAIGDHLGSFLHRVSIYAPPRSTEKGAAKRLMTRIAELFPRATEISLSTDFLKILISEKWRSSLNWPHKIQKMARKYEFNLEKCKISTGRLPRNLKFVPKGEEPRDLTQEQEEREIANLEETIVLDETNVNENGVEMLEDDDWIDDDDEECEGEDEMEDTAIVYESEEDELDDLERKLAKESDRRHNKWQKKKRVVIESDDEEEKENREEDHEDVVDWDKLSEHGEDDEEEENRPRNKLVDDEAEETDREEESEVDDEEEEEELENLEDSDDERLFINGPSRKRQIEQQALNTKRRRIVVSDEDSD